MEFRRVLFRSQVDSEGDYSTNFTLPKDSKQGAYTIQSKIQVNTGLLGILKTSTAAKLQTSSKFVVVSPVAFAVKAADKDLDVKIASNSNVSNFEFKPEQKKVSFTVEGETGTKGVTQITIPKAVLSGQLTVLVDDNQLVSDSDDVIVTSDTEAETTLEISYHHSRHTIDVVGTQTVPEFPISVLVMAVAVGLIVFAHKGIWNRLTYNRSHIK